MANMLYNGVELPDINEVWTEFKDDWPYAAIQDDHGVWRVQFTTAPLICNSTAGTFYAPSTGVNFKVYDCIDGSWTFVVSGSTQSGSFSAGYVWASYDVIYAPDGTVYLAASDPVDPNAGSHVTESSGDGFALYNGVKLPNIDSVWTDELKETHPYAYIRGHGGDEFSYELLFATLPFLEIGGGAITSISENGIGTGHLYYYVSSEKENGWLYDGEIEGGSGKVEDFTDLWASHDILYYADNSVYLVASDPIPLDGMTVIEWDGDTTGLTQQGYYYRLSDIEYFEPTSAISVETITDSSGNVSYGVQSDFIVETYDTYNLWALPGYDGDSVICYPDITSIGLEHGLYGNKDGLNNTSWYTSLIAYTPAPTSEEEDTTTGTVLYNGVELPALPEYDTAAYPYAMMPKEGFLILASGQAEYGSYVDSDTNKTMYGGIALSDMAAMYYFLSEDSTKWDLASEEIAFTAGTPLFGAEDGSLSIIWSNYNILNTDGSIYLLATDPVSAPAPAYLYNEVQLPVLPLHTDNEAYLYAAIFDTTGTDGTYRLIYTTAGMTVDDGTIHQAPHYYYVLEDGGAMWTLGGAVSDEFSQDAAAVIWANHNILNADDSTYLMRSIPLRVDSKISLFISDVLFDGSVTADTYHSAIFETKVFAVGDVLTVVFDGVSYTGVAASWNNVPIFGEFDSSGSDVSFSTYPFFIMCGYIDDVQTGQIILQDTETHTLKIVKPSSKVYYDGTETVSYSSSFGAYISGELLNEPGPSVGDTVHVVFDGVAYEDVVTTAASFGDAPMFGDLTLATRPYCCGYMDIDGDGTTGWFFATNTSGEHTIKVYKVIEGSGVTDTTVTVTATCTDLTTTTESVHQIYAWVFEPHQDYSEGTLYTSEAFAGPEHTEEITFTGLKPNTEYHVYAVIGIVDSGATGHNALATFTTLEGSADLKPVYLRINGAWVKQTAYERQNGVWVLISTAEKTEETATMLYNGVELPNINTVWTDKETYPYACVIAVTNGSTYLYLLSDVFSIGTDLGGDVAIINANALTADVYAHSDGEWGLQASSVTFGVSDMMMPVSSTSHVWSNHDLLNTDGSIYLAASDPVPVT